MARLLTFLAMIVGILLLYPWETNACGRQGDTDHQNQLNQLRNTISILEDEKYRILKENNAEKMKTKDEMASLNEMLTQYKRNLMETEDRLAKSETRGQQLTSSLTRKEEEFNAMMKKLKTCESELPPTVEAVRALRQQARQNAPIADKKDDTILKKDQTIMQKNEKIAECDKGKAVCQTKLEIAEKNLEKCETSTNEKDTKLDKWSDWYQLTLTIAFLGFIILSYVCPKVDIIMRWYFRTNQNDPPENVAPQQQPLAVLNFRQNNQGVGNAFPNQLQNGHAAADPRQMNQNFGNSSPTQMHHGSADVHPEAPRGPEREDAQTRQNRLRQRSLFEGPEARRDVRPRDDDRNVYQHAQAAPSSHVGQGQQIPRNDKVVVETPSNQHGVSAEQTLRRRSVPQKSDTVPGRQSPEKTNKNSTLSGQQPPRQLERERDSDTRSMLLVQQPNSATNTSASANASSSVNQEDIGDETRNGSMGDSAREHTINGTRNGRMAESVSENTSDGTRNGCMGDSVSENTDDGTRNGCISERVSNRNNLGQLNSRVQNNQDAFHTREQATPADQQQMRRTHDELPLGVSESISHESAVPFDGPAHVHGDHEPAEPVEVSSLSYCMGGNLTAESKGLYSGSAL